MDQLRSGVWDQSGHVWWNLISTKNTKTRWVCWCTPVITATQEPEAGELLQLRRRRFQWAEIVPLHSSLGNSSETSSPKKKKKVNFNCPINSTRFQISFLKPFYISTLSVWCSKINFNFSCPINFTSLQIMLLKKLKNSTTGLPHYHEISIWYNINLSIYMNAVDFETAWPVTSIAHSLIRIRSI